MAKRVRYRVTGKYGFPIDMLRYDQSFPADGAAASRIQTYAAPGKMSDEPVEIELITNNDHITEDRWASFGWYVVRGSVKRETW